MSAVFQVKQQRAEQNRKQNERERDDAVARDALFVAQRAQALHAAGGEVIHQARVARGRPAKMIADAVPQRGQIVFAHAEFVENFRRFAAGDGRERAALDFFKNGFRFFRRRRRGFFGGARNRRARRRGGGAKFGRRRARQLRVEFFDLGFERGDFGFERARLVGNRIGLFVQQTHVVSLSRENGDENSERAERHEQQRPRQREADFAKLKKPQSGERRRGRGGGIFVRRRGGLFGFAGERGNFQARGIPFHARVFNRGQRAGEFELKIFLRPGFVADGLHLGERGAEIGERLDHLLGVAARGELGFFEQAEAARQVLDDLVAAGLKFALAAAQFFEAGALAFEFFLRAFEFDEFLLGLDDFAVHVVARRRGKGGFARREIGVNKFRRVVFAGHAATLDPRRKSVKRV